LYVFSLKDPGNHGILWNITKSPFSVATSYKTRVFFGFDAG